MRLVQLKLRGSQFWNLPPINLNESQQTSPFLNVDLLTKNQKALIEKAVKLSEIYLLDTRGHKIKNLASVPIEGNIVSAEDIEEDVTSTSKVVSVSVSGVIKKKEKADTISESAFDEAMILLKRNGNTIKRIAKKLGADKPDVLQACLQLEQNGRKREGVLAALKEALGN